MCGLGCKNVMRSSGTLAHSQHLCACVGPEIMRSRERERKCVQQKEYDNRNYLCEYISCCSLLLGANQAMHAECLHTVNICSWRFPLI